MSQDAEILLNCRQDDPFKDNMVIQNLIDKTYIYYFINWRGNFVHDSVELTWIESDVWQWLSTVRIVMTLFGDNNMIFTNGRDNFFETDTR